jgi:FtsH-binding integral membrane protein
MANWNDPQPTRTGFGASPSLNGASLDQVRVDQGLRRYMLSIYNYMASGVLLSGVVAMLAASSPAVMQVLFGPGPLKWLVMLAPLGFVMVMSFGANRLSTPAIQGLFWAFAAIMGLSLSSIFMVFTGASIASTFFATAGAFAGLSLVGYTTKKDLSGMGSFLIMGLFGLIIASVINIFVQSSSLQWAISILGVLIFAGLTAYDTQRLKEQYYVLQGSEFMGKAIVLGALTLYLDFINMFQFLLSFMGNRE